MMNSSAVLLLAYGGPNSLHDVPAFLCEVRGGQPVSQVVIDETMRRYRLIGGRSPLLDITRCLASKLQNEIGSPVYVGMRHWHPFIGDTVHAMARDGISHAVAICLAPHYSALSIGAYHAKLNEARSACHCEDADEAIPVFDFIESWHTQPQYIAGIAQNVCATLAQFGADAKIIFTAHSLPVSARNPYEAQLRETARLIAQHLGLSDDRWMLCYQSAPRGSVAWLSPQVGRIVPQLAHAGEKNLVIAPIGFVADHLEVLYDIDIALQEIARANGVRLVRTPMLNDSDALVRALAELVRERNAQHVIRGA